MNTNYEELLNQIEFEIEQQSKLAFIVRGSELQEQAIKNLNEFQKEVEQIKEEFIKIENEQNANTLLSYEYYIEGVINEIKMVIQIKEDEPSKAWESLVNAQSCIGAALRMGIRCEEKLIDYYNKLHLIEKIFFPSQLFMSVGFIAEKSRCSLCEDDYENCDHIKGMPYMGKMCVEIFEKMYKLEEVSIVENPVDKRCRVYTIEENGKTIDFMTLREVNKK